MSASGPMRCRRTSCRNSNKYSCGQQFLDLRFLLPLAKLGFIQSYTIALLKTSSGSIHAVVHQISSKSNNIFSGIYGNLTILKMAAVRRLGFWKLAVCIMAFVGMPLCFRIQNFDEIRQSVDELWPKKRISRWRSRGTTTFTPRNWNVTVCTWTKPDHMRRS